MADTPSGPHRGLEKNGRDHAQDKQLRELQEHIKSWEAEEVRVHSAIEEGLRHIRDDLRTVAEMANRNTSTVARIEGRQSSNRFWWGLVMTIALGLIGGIWWGIDQGASAVQSGFNKVDAQLESTHQTAVGANHKIDSWIKEATRWGNDLEREDGRAKERIMKNETRIQQCCNGQQKDR